MHTLNSLGAIGHARGPMLKLLSCVTQAVGHFRGPSYVLHGFVQTCLSLLLQHSCYNTAATTIVWWYYRMASSRWNSAAVRQEITFEKWLPSYGCKHHSSRLKTAVECHETCTRASVETRDQTYTAQQVLATVCVDRQGKVVLDNSRPFSRCDE